MKLPDTILLWGLLSDAPTAALHDSIRRTGQRLFFLDQRAVRDTRVELVAGAGVEGSVRVGAQTLDLAAVKAAYLRPYDVGYLSRAEIPELAEAGPDGELWRHAAAVHEILLSWGDLSPALVLNRPGAMAPNGSKPYQAIWIESVGFRIPETLITTDPVAALNFWKQHERVIYKSLSADRSIVTHLTQEHLARFDNIASCPTQFQRYVSGVEYRVHVVGEDLFPCKILSDEDDYRYASPPAVMEACELPAEVSRLCRTLARSMDLQIAGIDLKCTPENDWYCFEVNPSPAFAWFQDVTQQPIAEAIAQLLATAR